MHNKTFLIFITFLAFMSCKSTEKPFSPENTKSEFIIFGTGGGFTGQVSKYYFTKEGFLYANSGEEIKLIGKSSKTLATQIFSNYSTLGLGKLVLNAPGNKYFFIESHIQGNLNSLKWGKEPLSNPDIETYFAILMNAVKKINNK